MSKIKDDIDEIIITARKEMLQMEFVEGLEVKAFVLNPDIIAMFYEFYKANLSKDVLWIFQIPVLEHGGIKEDELGILSGKNGQIKVNVIK